MCWWTSIGSSLFVLSLTVTSGCCALYRHNNVCPTLKDYATLNSNSRCWYTPNVVATLEEIVVRNGYPVEKHQVTTKDGYVLSLFRIPYSNYTNTSRNSRHQPVIVLHGIAGSGVFWVLQDRKSIGMFLADQGYDVWLPTFRGGTGSTGHVSLHVRDPMYWNFGLDELALYDIPAIVEYVSNATKQKGNIIFIGHSMGCTASYMYASEMADHAVEHLKALISLAPVAFIKHLGTLLKLTVHLSPVLLDTIEATGLRGSGQVPFLRSIITKVCGQYPFVVVCDAFIMAGSGFSKTQHQTEMVPVFFGHYPDGTSLKVLEHYQQIVLDNRFQKFSYTTEHNLELYGSTTPPEYNVTSIAIPVFLFIGRYDVGATEEDVDVLYEKLNSPKSKSYALKYVLNFAHNDYIIGRNFDEFYTKLLEFMTKLRST